jgi:type I restriction enzyme, S subunit
VISSITKSTSLPLGWVDAPIGEIADIVRGVSFPKDAKVSSFSDGYIACLRTTNVQREVEWDDLWFVPSRYVKRSEQMVSLEDTLISTANSRELVGKVALVSSLPVPATLGAFISLIRFPASVSRRFFFYELSSARVQETIRDSASTTTNISNVSTAKLATMLVRVAPLAEQHRIVAEIEKQFTRLDAAVAALKLAQANLKRYRAALLKAACEGRLLPTEAELARAEGREYEPADVLLARILDGRRAKWEADQLSKMEAVGKRPKDDAWKAKYVGPLPVTTADLETLPEGWAWATLGQITSESQNGLSKRGGDQGVPTRVLRLSDLSDGRLDETSPRLIPLNDKERSTYRLRDGDLVCIRVNGSPDLVGRLVLFESLKEWAFCDHFIRISLVPDGMAPSYVAILAATSRVRRQIELGMVSSAGQNTVSQVTMLGLPMAVPPVLEQRRIAGEVERRLSVIDHLSLIVQRALIRGESLRRAILKLAFEGQLASQDENDESASVLLEQMQAEKVVSGIAGRSRRTIPLGEKERVGEGRQQW